MIASPKRLLTVTAAIGAIAAAVAGCGGSDAATGSTIDTAALQQFQSCLSEYGVEMPQGGAPPSGGQPPSGGFPGQGRSPSKKMQKAFAACQQYAPQAPAGGPPGGFPGAPPSQ